MHYPLRIFSHRDHRKAEGLQADDQSLVPEPEAVEGVRGYLIPDQRYLQIDPGDGQGDEFPPTARGGFLRVGDSPKSGGLVINTRQPVGFFDLQILPSYTEGLPNIMLEAMACGTPVLATPVGAIPDVITDGKTGFIMENNSPECIAANVIRALNSPDLERIVEDGKRVVEENFTFEKVVENWKRVLPDIST
jgi:hypothetical protein